MADNQGITPKHLRNLGNLPPVDSKGAAIDEILDKFARDTFSDDQHGLDARAKAKQAILALLAQEVNKARIDELEKLENLFAYTDEYSDALSVIITRIEDLERLG